jgi:hypothetical protein
MYVVVGSDEGQVKKEPRRNWRGSFFDIRAT